MPNEFDSVKQRLAEVEKKVLEIAERLERLIEGNGLIVINNARFEIDESVRTSEIIKDITDLKDRVTELEEA